MKTLFHIALVMTTFGVTSACGTRHESEVDRNDAHGTTGDDIGSSPGDEGSHDGKNDEAPVEYKPTGKALRLSAGNDSRTAYASDRDGTVIFVDASRVEATDLRVQHTSPLDCETVGKDVRTLDELRTSYDKVTSEGKKELMSLYEPGMLLLIESLFDDPATTQLALSDALSVTASDEVDAPWQTLACKGVASGTCTTRPLNLDSFSTTTISVAVQPLDGAWQPIVDRALASLGLAAKRTAPRVGNTVPYQAGVAALIHGLDSVCDVEEGRAELVAEVAGLDQHYGMKLSRSLHLRASN